MNVEKFIKQLKESESYKKFRDEMNETSTTGMVAGYDTPKAFAPQDGEGKESFDAKTKDNAEQFGYKIAPKTKKKNFESKNHVNEISTTLGFAVMNIGESFIEGAGDGGEDDDNTYDGYNDDNGNTPHPTMRKTAEAAGYRVAREVKKSESAYKQVMKSLHEASYKEYKGDKTKTTSEKINHSIKELNQALLRVERAVGHALRLKTEMAVDQRTLWRSSHSRLVKIGERLNRIGKKINELGA
jgi:hypothetical protein